MVPLLVAVQLVLLHGVDGREIAVNPGHVSSMYAATQRNKLVTENVACVLWLANGKFISVIETCTQVREMFER